MPACGPVMFGAVCHSTRNTCWSKTLSNCRAAATACRCCPASLAAGACNPCTFNPTDILLNLDFGLQRARGAQSLEDRNQVARTRTERVERGDDIRKTRGRLHVVDVARRDVG